MIYVIKQGSHYSRHWPKLHFGTRKESIQFRFMDGCWIRPEEPDDFAISKLFGWSYGHHHRDSVRVGWTPNKEAGKIDLFFYTYNDDLQHDEPFATVEVGQQCILEVWLFKGRAFFSLERNDLDTIMDSVPFQIPWFKWGYYLFPYFGGKKTAPVTTKIELEIIP